MKLLIVVPDSELGGVTSAAVNFATELVSQGNEVYFLDMSNRIQDKKLLPEKVCIAHLEGSSCKWSISLEDVRKSKGLQKIGILLLGAVKKLTIKSGLWYKLIFSKFDRYGNFDVVLAFRQCEPCFSFVLNKVSAKKKIGFVHGELRYMGDISSWKRHMTAFHKIAYVSNAVKEEFISAYPELADNACTIYNMFDVERIRRMAQEKPAVELDPNVRNIVTVARIDNAFKQIHWIPQICANLKERTSVPFHWYILGDGPDYAKTVMLAEELGVSDVLTFLGNQQNPFAIWKRADFTVLTSKSEAYPMVVLESFILCKPIVVGSFPSVYEMMEHGHHGFIASQDVLEMTEYILKMVENTHQIATVFGANLMDYSHSNVKAYVQFLEAIN